MIASGSPDRHAWFVSALAVAWPTGEVAAFGIKVTLVEPSGFATDWAGPSAKRSATLPIYDHIREARVASRRHLIPGEPEATGPAILKIVDAEDPPLRVFFGSVGLPAMKTEYARRIETWEEWNAVALEAQGDWAAKQAK